MFPPTWSTGIRAIADRWTAGAANDYERILAIQDHLSDPSQFIYDKTVPARDDSYTILEFLTTTKRGFCQQFSSAMAVMLRTLGFPSRVAIGYTPGQRDPDTGVYHVTTSELHSWVEVLFPTYGWLAFEPTPGRTNPVANEYQHPAVSCPPGPRDAPPLPLAEPRRRLGRRAIRASFLASCRTCLGGSSRAGSR